MKFIENNNIADPAVNLAIEEFVVRNLEINENYCFLYRNNFCSVSGKNQNIFEEIDYKYFVKNNLPFYRRISGGGTVIHDPGNLNFSFITRFSKNRYNKYEEFTRPVIELLNKLGAEAYLNTRNDIFIENKKISGNAQFTSRDRMMSHGTLLFNSDLQKLSRALKTDESRYKSKSSKSTKSSVANILPFLKTEISIEEFKKLVKNSIWNNSDYTGEYHFSDNEWGTINDLAEKKYRSFEWNIGRSPNFSFENKFLWEGEEVKLKLSINQGSIDLCKIISENPNLSRLSTAFIGVKYEWTEIKKILADLHSEFSIDQNLLNTFF